MTFFTDEASSELNEGREGIAIRLPNETIRICTGTRSVVIDGNTFRAEPSARTELSIAQGGGQASMPMLVLPAKHAFVQRYMSGTVPPRYIEVDLYRLQLNSNEWEVTWRGKIASVSFQKTTAKFALPSRLLSIVGRRCPPFAVARVCGNILYDANCQVVKNSFRVSTTIADVNGHKITVASMAGNPSQWALNGEIHHVPSGERMPIADQTGSVLTIQFPVIGWQVGHAVEVFAGCDQTIATCRDKFSNRARFNGSPYLNRETLPTRPGFGVWTSE